MSACDIKKVIDISDVVMAAVGAIATSQITDGVVDRQNLAKTLINDIFTNSTGITEDLKEIAYSGELLSNDLGAALIAVDTAIEIANEATNAPIEGDIDITALAIDEAKTYLEKLQPAGANTSALNGALVASNESEQTSDGDITPEDPPDAENDEELLPPADLPTPSITKKLSAVYSQYLINNLRGYEEDLEGLFMHIASRAWLSTDIDSETGMQFDESAIRANIVAQLNSMINSYYQRSAKLIYTVNSTSRIPTKFSTSPNGLLVFNNKNQLPSTAESLYNYEVDDNKIEFYTSNFLKNADGKPLLLAVYDGNIEDTATILGDAFMDPDSAFRGRAELDFTSEIEGVNNNFKALNTDTAQILHSHQDSRSAYFAAIIRDNLDVFINDLLPQLNTAFQTTIDTGMLNIDAIGSDLASRLLKLSIASTPLLYETAPLSSVKNSTNALIVDINRNNTALGAALNKSNLIAKVDGDGNKIIKFNRFDETVYAITLNIGGIPAVLVSRTDAMPEGAVHWSYAQIVDGEIVALDQSALYDENLSGPVTAAIRMVLDQLNDSTLTNDIIEKTLVKDMGGAAKRSFLDVTALIDTTFIPEASNEPTMLVSNNIKGNFLYEAELEVAAELLQSIPADFAGAKAFLKDANRAIGS